VFDYCSRYLRNRGVRDVLIVCCDGLPGLPEAIETVWPTSTVQTCTVHLIRAAMRYVSYNDRKRFAAALRPVYTAPTVDAAEAALLELADSPLGRKYKAAVAVWERAWDRFVPFLAFPPEIRKIVYTTNAIESFNYQIRTIIKNRGQFPTDDAVIKLIWLAHRRHRRQASPRPRTRPGQAGQPRPHPRTPTNGAHRGRQAPPACSPGAVGRDHPTDPALGGWGPIVYFGPRSRQQQDGVVGLDHHDRARSRHRVQIRGAAYPCRR
jgi:hypothetical protein